MYTCNTCWSICYTCNMHLDVHTTNTLATKTIKVFKYQGSCIGATVSVVNNKYVDLNDFNKLALLKVLPNDTVVKKLSVSKHCFVVSLQSCATVISQQFCGGCHSHLLHALLAGNVCSFVRPSVCLSVRPSVYQST